VSYENFVPFVAYQSSADCHRVGFFIALSLSQLFSGAWSDRKGREPVMVAGLPLAALGIATFHKCQYAFRKAPSMRKYAAETKKDQKRGCVEDEEKEDRSMNDDSAENRLLIQCGSNSDQPGLKVQVIEVAVFLFLIVPSMSTSFFIGNQSGNPSDVDFMTVAIMSILSDLSLVSLVFYFVWRNKETLRRIGWTFQTLPKEVGWGLVLFFPILYSANRLEGVLHSAGLSAPSKLPSFLVATGHSRLVLAVIMVIVVAIVEETIFRGYLILRLKTATRRPWAAVLLSSVVFSIGHGYEGMAGVISVFCLGVVFAVVYLWRKSLIAPIIIHFLIDFSSIVMGAI
jgi:membrane protease YdiL (CAAX protease family)